MSSCSLGYSKIAARAIMCRLAIFESVGVDSSVIPSVKFSSLGSGAGVGG